MDVETRKSPDMHASPVKKAAGHGPAFCSDGSDASAAHDMPSNGSAGTTLATMQDGWQTRPANLPAAVHDDPTAVKRHARNAKPVRSCRLCARDVHVSVAYVCEW
jgi:hypothetical protein